MARAAYVGATRLGRRLGRASLDRPVRLFSRGMIGGPFRLYLGASADE